jgi:hypothetical protein
MASAAIGQLAAWGECSAGMLEKKHLFFSVSYTSIFSEYSSGETLMQLSGQCEIRITITLWHVTPCSAQSI